MNTLDLHKAIWANHIQRLCLEESGGDIEAALSAADIIVSSHPIPKPIDTPPTFPTTPEDYPRDKSNRFLGKHRIAEAARDNSKLVELRAAIPESEYQKLDNAITHLHNGGTVHHPTEHPGLGITLEGYIPLAEWRWYAEDMQAWEKRELSRLVILDTVEGFRKLVRNLRAVDKAEENLLEYGALRAGTRIREAIKAHNDRWDRLTSELEKINPSGSDVRHIRRLLHRSYVEIGRRVLDYDRQSSKEDNEGKLNVLFQNVVDALDGARKEIDESLEDIADKLCDRVDEEGTLDRKPTEPPYPSPTSASFTLDQKGHEHRGKGPGGGQFVSRGAGGGSVSEPQPTSPDVSQEQPAVKKGQKQGPVRTAMGKAGRAVFRAVGAAGGFAMRAAVGSGGEARPDRADVVKQAMNWAEERLAKLPGVLRWPLKALFKLVTVGGYSGYTMGQAAAKAVAREVGGEEHAQRVGAVCATLDNMAAAATKVALIAGHRGPQEVSFYVPIASASYVAYSTVRHPVATFRAAGKGVAAALEKLRGKKQQAQPQNEQPQPTQPNEQTQQPAAMSMNNKQANFTNEDIRLLVDAYNRHPNNPDWYGAQLANAIAHTGSVKEAIELADIMNEMNPVSPFTTDSDEDSAQQELEAEISRLIGSDEEETEDQPEEPTDD